ncbi:unnamed protein product, partial [Laminaria digitata]
MLWLRWCSCRPWLCRSGSWRPTTPGQRQSSSSRYVNPPQTPSPVQPLPAAPPALARETPETSTASVAPAPT